jgi:hypothetical protein
MSLSAGKMIDRSGHGDRHDDNGSEYINHEAARTLGKPGAEFTKSRPRHSDGSVFMDNFAPLIMNIFSSAQ